MRSVTFMRDDGVRFVATEGSPAYERMATDGGFMLVEVEGVRQPVSAVEPTEAPDLGKMKKADLLKYAAEKGIEVNPKATAAAILGVIREAEAASSDEQ